MSFNKEYIQKKKLEALNKKAGYYDSMKTPLRILIINILYDAKTQSAKLTLKDIQNEIIKEVGELEFTESQIRRTITSLNEEGVIVTVPSGNKNYMYLTGSASPTTIFMNTSQNFVYTVFLLISLGTLLYNYAYIHISPLYTILSYYTIFFILFTVTFQLAEYKMSIMGFNFVLSQFVSSKIEIIKQHPYILVIVKKLRSLPLKFRKSVTTQQNDVFSEK